MDTLSKERRSWNMSRIKGCDTKPELLVRSFLHRHGFRFRLHVKDLPGKPDIVLPKYKVIIEVRGCYWHRHPECKFAYIPKSNLDFWYAKFRENVERDKKNDMLLQKLGWKVIVIWECEMEESLLRRNLSELICSKKNTFNLNHGIPTGGRENVSRDKR